MYIIIDTSYIVDNNRHTNFIIKNNRHILHLFNFIVNFYIIIQNNDNEIWRIIHNQRISANLSLINFSHHILISCMIFTCIIPIGFFGRIFTCIIPIGFLHVGFLRV